MKRLVSLAFVLLMLIAVPPIQAERKPYALDRSHCQLNFVGEALLLSAHGYFERWDAEIQMDRENLENSTVSVTIDAASINTRITRRDDHLRSADFLDVAKNPQIKFVSSRIGKVDDKNVKITGDLTLRGVTKTVGVPVKIIFLRDGDARFKGELEINRKEYGMMYNSRMNPVEDNVAIQFDLHIVDQKVMEERQRQRQQQTPPRPPLN